VMTEKNLMLELARRCDQWAEDRRNDNFRRDSIFQLLADCSSALRRAASTEPVIVRELPICCVTGRIAGDKDACGDCDPCGAAHAVPEAVKALLKERDEWADRYSAVMAELDELRSSAEPALRSSGESERRAMTRNEFVRIGILQFKEHELREIVAIFCKLPGIAPRTEPQPAPEPTREEIVEQCIAICMEEAEEWDSDNLQSYKNYAGHCANRITEVFKTKPRSEG
jgi:hypothetical protein